MMRGKCPKVIANKGEEKLTSCAKKWKLNKNEKHRTKVDRKISFIDLTFPLFQENCWILYVIPMWKLKRNNSQKGKIVTRKTRIILVLEWIQSKK